MPGPIKAHFESGEQRRKALAKAGVIGTISIANPKAAEVPWSRVAASRFQPRMELRDPGSDVPPPLQVSITFNPKHAEMLFAGSGHTFDEVLAALNADKPLPHFPLAVKVRSHLGMTRSEVKSENVVGVLPGQRSRPQERIRRRQRPPRPSRNRRARQRRQNLQWRDGRRLRRRLPDRNRPRAERFRSKAQALDSFPLRHGRGKGRARLSIFRRASHRVRPHRRRHQYGHVPPALPTEIPRSSGSRRIHPGRRHSRGLREGRRNQVQADKEPEHNRFIRSDQYSFIKKGVPSLAFKFGYIPGTPEEKIFKTWYADRYHAPSDDLSQPVDMAAAAQFNAILEKLALRVADADHRPEWKPDSFFRRFAK